MKITRVSLQSKLDELISLFHTYLLMKITRVSLQSKLDELISMLTRILHPASIAVKHALFSSTNTCGTIKSVHPASIAVILALFSSNNTCVAINQFIQLRLQWNSRYFHRKIRVNNEISSSSFDCSETRVIFIEEYVSTLKSVHPASIAVKHALFSSKNTCGRIKEVHPASISMKLA